MSTGLLCSDGAGHLSCLRPPFLGDLINRSATFLIDKYSQQQPSIDKHLERLHRVLMRMDIVVEEADGRHITNQGMLRQLKMLRQGMYRGHYVLDTFRYQPLHGEVSHSSSALSKSHSAKRLRSSASGNSREALPFTSNSLQEMVAALEYDLADIKEFTILLVSCPRMIHQPYSQYLLLDNCMFGRQTEGERVLTFLLQKEASPGAADLAVLPVVGPIRSGKSTLVEHVCKDERVRDRFSLIIYISEKKLKDEGAIILGQNMNGLVKHQKCASQNRLLLIIEVAEDIEEGHWERLKSSTIAMAPSGSKIIITSRSNKIESLGTTAALQLDYLTPEAYWYFFKMLAFETINPNEHPTMTSMAMEIALELGQCFCGAHIIGGVLRENFNPPFWCTILNALRAGRQKNILSFDEHPSILVRKDRPLYSRLTKSSRYMIIYSYQQSDSSVEVPKISMRDILLGSGDTLPIGRFKALAWKSRIAPYYNYSMTCMIEASRSTMGKKKHVRRGHLI